MYRILIWLLRIAYIFLCVMSLLTGGVLLVYMTFPFTVDSAIQFVGGMYILAFGFVMIYFIVDSWRY